MSQRYELIDERARGGFGRVVHARDTWLERDIALKILDPIMALEERERARFEQEARTLARLSHPGIPAIYDVVFNDTEEPGIFQIIFEFVAGPTLQELLDERQEVTLQEAKAWFEQLSSALAHAHTEGVIHRDIKPANIIIRDSSATATLVDFGIALTRDQAERLTRSGYVIGTPGYMSPEQEEGGDLDERADIFSMGVCLYQALGGSMPNPHAYRPLSDIDESIPVAIDDLIRDCLVERGLRVQSVMEFSQKLSAALRTKVSLSTILTGGTLGDLNAALQQMAADEYAEHPAGSRQLIIAKVVDLASSGKPSLEPPLVNLLSSLVGLGTRLDPTEYQEIVELALRWGFEHVYETGEKGRSQLRRSLAAEGVRLAPGSHSMVASRVLEFFAGQDLGGYEYGPLVGARELVDGLLANRACQQDAVPLGQLRRSIDERWQQLPGPA